MSKWFWAGLVLVVGVLIGLFAFFNNRATDPLPDIENPHEVTDADHILGPPEAAVTLVEYADFQCPSCKNAAPLVKRLSRDFPDQLRIVLRHFPLTAIHPNAFAAARAAEAAGGQGKFFEMHDLLFEKQDEWASSPQANALFREYASQLGLDLDKYTEVYNAADTTDRINLAIRTGQSLDVSSTPTFFINGEQVEPNPRNYEEFKSKIEAALRPAS